MRGGLVMSDNIRSWPVVETIAEAEEHDFETPALVPSAGQHVRVFLVFQEKLFDLNASGTLARAIEMLLFGLADNESSLVYLGLRDALTAATALYGSAGNTVSPPESSGRMDSPSRLSRPYLKRLCPTDISAFVIEVGEADETEIQPAKKPSDTEQ